MNEAEQIVRELIESDAEDLGTWKDLVPEPQAVQDLAKLRKYRPYIHHEYDHYYAPFVVPVWTPTGRLAKSKCWHGWYRMEGFTYSNPPTWEQEVEAVGKLFPNRLPGFHPSRLQRLVRQGYRIGKPYDPYRQRFYESIDEALNPEVCAQCKGKCCAFYPGMTSPEDWGAPDQELMRERITQAVASGKYDFDSWYGDPTGKSEDDADVWMVRPASERQPLHQLDRLGYERCRMMGDKGCELAYGQRPRQCRELEPKEGGQGCGDQYSKKQAAIDWMPYQQLLHGIIYGTNESEDDFDAKDLTPLSAQEIELAAATEIADRLHQAGLKFIVKGDLATRAAAWPDLYKLVTLGKDAQFVLDQRLKNATTGQDYVRFWTIIPYSPDYGDYYTTWQWHLQDVVGKDHKLWLHNRGLVEVNIDVGESTQKEMVERLMVAIQEAKPIDRERLEKVYNKLYGQAADALSKRKPCAIDASTGRVTCLGSREGIYGDPITKAKYGGGAEMDTLCCTGCTHHTPQGCAAEKPLACKTWLCPHAAVKNPELAKRLRDLQSRAMKAKVYEPRGDMPTAISRGLRSWQWAKEEPRVLRPDYEEPGAIDTWTDQEKWAEAERLFGPEPQEYLAYQDWLDRVEEWWYSGLGESRLQVVENVGRVVGPIQEVRLVRWAATKHVPTGKIGRDYTHWDATEQLLKQGVIPGVNSLHDLDGMEDQNQATAFLQQLEDGYILDDGRFVTRDEGEHVAREMGQLRGAETEKVEREAIDADDIDMDMDIEEAQGTPEPDYDAVARYAHAWFKKNARNFNDWPYEIGFALYWSPQGKVVPGTLVQGEAAEVQWPEQPELGIEIGSIHSHTGCSAELSDFDAEEGQKVANRTGQFYAMFVIGPDDEGEGVTMVEEVFEPNVNESVDDECDWKELVPDHLGHIKFMCPFTLVQREGQPLVKHYFSDEVGDWIEEFDQATIYQINDYAKNGVIDLNDCPMGTEAIINVTPDGQFLQEIPLDGACGWKIVDSYVPESEGDDFDVKEVTGEPVAFKVRYMCRKGRTYQYFSLTLTASTEEEALTRFQNWDWPDARARRVISVEPVYSFHEAVDGDDVDMKEITPDPRIFTLHWHGFDGQWYHTKPLPSLERAIKLAFEWSLFTIKGDEAYIEEQHPEDPYNFIARHHLNDNYEVSNEEEGSSGRWFGVGEEPPLDESDEDFDAKELTTPEDVLPIFQFTFEDDTREHGPRIEQVPVPWAVLQRHAGDWATLNKKDAAYMPLDDPCDYALPYVRKLHPDWPWGQLNDIRIVNKVEESEDDFDMKELTPESVRPVAFQLTFDFGAGEDGYSIQVFVPLEEFAPRFQTRDQIVAQWDEDMSVIEDTVIEYAQRTRTDIDRDDWSFVVGVDLLPAEERQRGHMILVQNGDDPLVRCSVCGHEGNLMSDFSYLKAGFNGIQPGGADDLDLQECGACGAYLAWSSIRNVNESDEDFDAKELDMPVFNPQLIVDEMKTNGWVQVSCTLSHPAEQVWLLEWNSPLELTHDMPEDEYNREADRAEAAGQAAILGAYPQATKFEFLAPFTDGDFGLYFHIPGEYRATHTGYVTIGYQVMKLFSQWGITLRGIGKLDFEAQSVNLAKLLQSDPDFAAFVQAHPDIQPPASPNLPTVVVDGKIISGYERPASRLKKGETDVWGYVSPVGTGKHQVAEAKIIATESEEDFDTKEVADVPLPAVPAHILSDATDAHGIQERVDFNAVGWLLQANIDQIRALAHCGWSRDYPADDVARELAAENQELANFLDTVLGGFEVYVDQRAAEAFLKQFRSDVYDQLRAEHEILESNTRGLPPPVEAEVREIHALLQQSADALRALDDRASLDERDDAVESLGQCAERLDNLDLNYAIQDFPALDWVLDAIRGAKNDLLDLLNTEDWAKAEDADVVQRVADVMADLLK